jgi:hypothetical protein
MEGLSRKIAVNLKHYGLSDVFDAAGKIKPCHPSGPLKQAVLKDESGISVKFNTNQGSSVLGRVVERLIEETWQQAQRQNSDNESSRIQEQQRSLSANT